MISPLISLPRRYVAAHDKQDDIQRRGDLRLRDLNEQTTQRRSDIITDPTITLRQQYHQLTELERNAARERITYRA